jgi:hypothetical protein
MPRGPTGRAAPGTAVPELDTCGEDCAPATAATPDVRWLRNARYARWLAWASLAWMAAEGAVGLAAGVAAGSIALVGWALGNGIEALASVIVVWRFTGSRMASETAERRAQRAVAVSFWLLAPYIAVQAIGDLAAHHPASPTLVGIALTASSLVIMHGQAPPRRAARFWRHGRGRHPEPAVRGPGRRVLFALVVVAAWPSAWQADPIIALGIAAWSAWEGRGPGAARTAANQTGSKRREGST